MRSLVVRTLLAVVLFSASLSGLARAQTAGTTFRNNQDPSNTPAEQSMQAVGGPSHHAGVNVQGRVKPVPNTPSASTTHHLRTVIKTTAAKPADSTSPNGSPK